MKYVMIIVDTHNISTDAHKQRLKNFLDKGRKIQGLHENNSMLNNCTFLLPLKVGLLPLTTLANLAEHWDIQLRFLFFDEKPELVSLLP